jgi:hypothetical protein
MKVHTITMSMDRHEANYARITDWFRMMDVQKVISREDGYLSPKECDVLCDGDKQIIFFFFTNAHLACLFKMRFG